jgi:hypothetical protein
MPDLDMADLDTADLGMADLRVRAPALLQQHVGQVLVDLRLRRGRGTDVVARLDRGFCYSLAWSWASRDRIGAALVDPQFEVADRALPPS